MPSTTETKEITQAAFARLRKGLTPLMVARRIGKSAAYVRVCETKGCAAFGTAWQLHLTTGARLEQYQYPEKIAIPFDEYQRLTKAALENEKNDHRYKRIFAGIVTRQKNGAKHRFV